MFKHTLLSVGCWDQEGYSGFSQTHRWTLRHSGRLCKWSLHSSRGLLENKRVPLFATAYILMTWASFKTCSPLNVTSSLTAGIREGMQIIIQLTDVNHLSVDLYRHQHQGMFNDNKRIVHPKFTITQISNLYDFLLINEAVLKNIRTPLSFTVWAKQKHSQNIFYVPQKTVSPMTWRGVMVKLLKGGLIT